MEILTHSEMETEAVARKFALDLKGGDVVLLHGDLGAGKSVFCRRLIRSLCGDDGMEVPSPTFTLVQTYEAALDGADVLIWHFDLYRLWDASEIYEIGWEEAVAGGIVLVEWPERLGGLLPARRIDVFLGPVADRLDARMIRVERT
ncbi:MAG: tRNA (adenosine(37)-N6)-threonylcarbamoyltransferase complex ATPase subunit type 1 TsaE [Alphaproteobacteria bacterium]|nr:tRNA (adenosine(37)-N6)-threonylcarbamoyltransferase complex ATPase subunit type 1 TsaE [Alphaproteobacteria bacterium]